MKMELEWSDKTEWNSNDYGNKNTTGIKYSINGNTMEQEWEMI